MESILAAIRDLSIKDLIALIFSFVAVVISVIGLRRSAKERDRVFRSTLTDVLGKVIESNIELIKLQHDYIIDTNYLNKIGSVFAQRHGFLVEQASYIAGRIPTLVRTYEWNTLASAQALLGNFDEADKHYKTAITVAPNLTQKGQALRTHGQFLYQQANVDKGRVAFKEALEAFTKEDNTNYFNQGFVYQNWAWCERELNRSPEIAEQHFSRAREKFNMIDFKQWKEKALADLQEAQTSSALAPRGPAPNVHDATAVPHYS